MATFVVKNIIKITSLVDFDAAFKPYRQNFTHVLKGRDVLELRTNEPEKSLYYYKAVLPYAEVEMIDEFDYAYPITYNIVNGSTGTVAPTEIRVGQEVSIAIGHDDGYYCPLESDVGTNALNVSENCEITNYEMINDAIRITIRCNEPGDVTINCTCQDFNFALEIPASLDDVVLGKSAQELQLNVQEMDGDFYNGELNYISGWTDISDDASYQSGHFMMVRATTSVGNITISTDELLAPVAYGNNGLCVFYLGSTSTRMHIESRISDGSGYQILEKHYTFNGITLRPQP